MSKTKKSSRLAKASDVMRYRPKPSLKIYSDELPMVKDLKVGETRTFIVTAKVKSIYAGDSEYISDYDEEGGADKRICATMKVTNVKEK